ncbi:MAG: polymerase sigma-70 factor, subfamily [Acidimicrobiaceae bacterium]|nr:polymerase sigma-70 factor, subfamily [Acidimicrobiaceae bacterium]
MLEDVVRRQWWPAVAALCRVTGDLSAAEDAVQEACAAAVQQWAADGIPANPVGWLVRVARNKAVDTRRRDALRSTKEQASMDESLDDYDRATTDARDDMLSLIFLCCHPALDPSVRIALTLRAVCGLSVKEVAAGFLVPEATMAKRLVRARQKIRDSRIPLRTPVGPELDERLPSVLRVIYVTFTEGHAATTGFDVVRGDLCDVSIAVARDLAALMPDNPEVLGLLALLLLTDARRPARADPAGDLVLLEDQDRRLWNRALLDEGRALVERALPMPQLGPYQIHAAIAACHADAQSMDATDWRQIALLYDELIRLEPSPVIEANRAVAVAMSESPAAGLVILDAVGQHPQLQRWPQLHIARGELLRRCGRPDEAALAFRAALELEPGGATRTFILRRLSALGPEGATPPHG